MTYGPYMLGLLDTSIRLLNFKTNKVIFCDIRLKNVRNYYLRIVVIKIGRWIWLSTLFFYKNAVFLTQAEYSYSSADFTLKIFFTVLLTYHIFVLECIGASMTNVRCSTGSAGFFVLLASFAVQRKE